MSAGQETERATPQEMEELERQSALEAPGTQPDPGPNAEISRESPSGKPGDTTKTRDNPFPGGAP
jgi:hypothetical protein